MKLACIVGARPNFMKMAPILRACEVHEDLETTLIHTGQHYDKSLSDVFFDELQIKRPEISLGIGSGTHGEQTGKLIIELEKTFLELKSKDALDRVVVVGDVNSTMAATLAAAKINVPVAHVEAGLRSFDRAMPEEINRIVTDSICDLLLASEPDGVKQLEKEGHDAASIFLVGNVMIDTLMQQLERAQKLDTLQRMSLDAGGYCMVTLHRPSNVDEQPILEKLVDVLVDTSSAIPVVFPVHPRTQKKLEEFQLLSRLESAPHVHIHGPMGYLDFLCLTSQAKVIVTDSGGLQEESTVLGVPCLTMRENTERPVTVTAGTSTLIGNDSDKLQVHLQQVIDGTYKKGGCPQLWDGQAASRIVDVIRNHHA